MKRLFKKHDYHTHEILSKGAIAFLLKIVGAGLAFLLQAAIARYLGASDAGLYFITFTIITLLATVSRLGMDNSVTRFVASNAIENDWGMVTGVVWQALRITVLISLLICIISIMLSDWVSITLFNKPELSSPLSVMSLFILPLALVSIYAGALQGLKKIRDVMLIKSVIIPAITLLSMHFMTKFYGLQGAVLAYGGGIIVALMFGYYLWNQTTRNTPKVVSVFPIKILLKSGFPLLGAGLMETLSVSLPLLVLGIVGTNADAGIYSAAQKTAGIVGLVLIAANAIIAPKFAELYKRNDMVALEKVARHGAALVTAMALPALLILLIFPRWVMGVYGDEFIIGAPMLVIITLGQFVNVITGSVGYLLMMTGHEKSFFHMNAFSLSINFVLCVTLIPLYGGVGASIAMAVSLATVNLMRVRYIRRKLNINAFPHF